MSKPPRQDTPLEGEGDDAEGVVADRRERSERPTRTSVARDLPPLAPVAVRMESLLTWVAERTAKFPRDSKFTVGDRWLEACLDVQTALMEATYRPARDPGKARALQAANRALTRARVLARLASHVGALSSRQVIHFVTESDEVGRMMGGWLRHVSDRRADTTV